MSYNNQFFGYANSFSIDHDDGDETPLWHHPHQPHYVQISQPTVDPFQVFDQSDAYNSPRSYNSDRRYHNSNRQNFGVTPGMEPLVIQHMPPTASAQRFNTYNVERQVRERPQIMVEVRTQPTRSSQRYYCEHDDCFDPNTGIRRSVSRKADLRRHAISTHGGTPKFDCKYPRCTRKGDNGFYREDHYREHLRGYHNQELPPKKTARRNS